MTTIRMKSCEECKNIRYVVEEIKYMWPNYWERFFGGKRIIKYCSTRCANRESKRFYDKRKKRG